MMAILAQYFDLGVSEIAALKWGESDLERRQVLVRRKIVNGRVDGVQTEYFQD